MRGRTAAAAVLACLLLASCGGTEDKPAPEDEAAPAPAFSAQVDELCRPVFEKFHEMRKADGKRKFAKAAAATARAERKLAEALDGVETPPGSEEAVATYVEMLEEYSAAHVRTTKGRGSPARVLDDVVHAAKTEVRLFEASERVGLPSTCPPVGNAYTTLFVARANRDCFEVRRTLTRSPDPTTRAAAIELLDVAHRATADVARALRRSLPPRFTLRVQRIVTLGKDRLRTLERLREAVVAGDLAAFEEAWPEVVATRRRLARQMLTVGLVECGKLFGLLRI